ncbi:GspE/PulE family protein [Hymenobacter lucidus]|uniref:GspE/PulE family protein n=1 Tax=Hymenobacter lucidus TaxID=2880930 RepID=A0ABS8AZB7_9BACT|nr:GspE/PulE family protein [Hymenobacter lucidus]MCB2411155.1 GspE/PulE family protein [Hymenobacter lucidus]
MSELEYIPIEAGLMQVISAEMAWHYRIVPRSQEAGKVAFFAEAPTAAIAEELEVVLGQAVLLQAASSAQIERTLNKYFRRAQSSQRQATPQAATVRSPATEDFLFQLIAEARQLGSSDIHIETYAEKARVRIRIDGLLVERYHLPKSEYPALINRVKIMSGLDIAEKRLPQDGRIFFTAPDQRRFDIRVSVLPTLHGEKAVLRLLSNDTTNLDLNTLGFHANDLTNYLEGIRRPTGMVLISGPTGSGKTTTLYATLKLLNQESRNITTIEDPIEYTLEGINQVQLRENIGLDFSKALRTFLRQDPNVIMVGEIRDPETATMAIRASLTGHLVLSTIHTNSAWGTVARLVDMGVPPYLVATTLNTSVAQRLLRLLCPHCKREEEFSTSLYPRRFHPFRPVKSHYLAAGCDLCYYTGYRGRQAVYEVIPLDAELADFLKNENRDVSSLLQQRGIVSLAENAFALFERGDTTLDEIYPLLFGTL